MIAFNKSIIMFWTRKENEKQKLNQKANYESQRK